MPFAAARAARPLDYGLALEAGWVPTQYLALAETLEVSFVEISFLAEVCRCTQPQPV